MAYKIDYTKRYLNKVKKLTAYLEREWGYAVAAQFTNDVAEKLERLSKHPFIGNLQGRKTIRSIIISKHNRLYYRIEGEKITILNLMDMRIDPANNPYNK